MANCMAFHTQMASIMEVLANAAVAEICKLVDDDYAVFRLEITQSQKENKALRRKLQQLEIKVARDRADRTMRERGLASQSSNVKILDRYRGKAKVTLSGEGHHTGGHRNFVKPVGQNTWRDDQPITVDEGIGNTTHHVIESAEAAGPGVKQEKSEGEVDPRHSRDIQTGAAGAPPVATENHTTAQEQSRTRRSIMVSGTLNAIFKSETDTKTLTGLNRLGCPPAPRSEYSLYANTSPRTVLSHRDSGDTLQTVNDPSCSYTTEMIPGDMPVVLDAQTNPMKVDWNQYSSSGYSEGCLDKKRESLVVDEVTVKVEGDAPLTWNAYETHLGEGHSQGNTIDFLDYRESLETNLNVVTHSPLHTFTHDPLSDSHREQMAKARGEGATSGNGKEKRFLCMFCNKGFSCPQKVDIHQRVHTGLVDLKDGKPDLLLVKEETTSDNASASTLNGYTRPLTNVNSCNAISRFGGKEKRFPCSFCGEAFSCPQKVEIHQRVHTWEIPFIFTQCHLCFAQAGHLKRYQMVHIGEKSYSCPQCEDRFSHQLNIHLKVHTGERPFVCMHCRKRF
ncbi:uncharacterized protein LOC115191594 [Salmo trutta]|uniref:uncharacterized protein LOC115191594 n=1 Tax=Salmo trutta TaxID=8032 RepID=UPI00113253F9|nr:uncharacterized protein LOC115191594 [Salmo trutta]